MYCNSAKIMIKVVIQQVVLITFLFYLSFSIFLKIEMMYNMVKNLYFCQCNQRQRIIWKMNILPR